MSQLDERIRSAKEDSGSVPEVVSNRMNQTLANLPERNKKSKWPISIAAAAVLLFIGLIGSSYLSPVMAKSLSTIPVVGSLFAKVGDPGQQNASLHGLTSPLHASIETSGASLAFEGVVYDGNRLSLSYVVRPNSEEKWTKKEISSLLDGLSLAVNGKPLGNYSLSERGQMIKSGEYAGVITLVPGRSLPDHFQLKVNVHKLGGDSGNWSAQFPVKKVGGHSFLLNQTKTEGERTIRLNKVTFGSTSTDVSFQLKQSAKFWNQQNKELSYELYDDHGKMLQIFSSGGARGSSTSINTGNEFAEFEPLNTLPKYLVFQPVLYTDSKKSAVYVKKPLASALPIKLSQGKDGDIIITKVSRSGGKVTMTFRVDGKDPYDQAGSIWLSDQNRKDSWATKPPKRLKSEGYLFQLTFDSVDPQKTWDVTTVKMQPPKVLKGLRFKIAIR